LRSPSRLTSLLATVALAAIPTAALAQSAGDEQYQDPFGSETTQTQSGSQGTGTTPTEPGSTLTDEPQVTPQITQPPSVDSLGDVPRTTNRGGRLAETGIDTRLFLALGVALLVAGIGLRLRTIPERF